MTWWQAKKKLMEENFYYSNRQKLLKVAMELHHAGYEKLRIVPSLAPSGMYWRCEFLSADKSARCNTSNWIFKIENENILKEILASAKELAKIFILENSLFIEKCLGKDAAYVTWYKNVISNLKEGELPYAFADWEIPTDTWATNLDRKISAYPNDKEFNSGTSKE